MFLRPRLHSLSDPFLLPNMDAAVARILAAIDRKQRIVLFGDYDVDGVTSLSLLFTMLRGYGCSPDLFLPLRMEEGYGLSRESVDRCSETFRPELLIALDCGTSSREEIRTLVQRGVDVLVIDHHEPKSDLPECTAIVNPKTDPDSAFHYLCTVGIVFKLCHALLKRRPLDGFDLKAQLDLVALGTVADIVPLAEENRMFVQRGAIEIGRTKRIGLRKLIQVSAVRPPILSEDIGFRLGPRVNAAGRLTTAEKALRLLLTEDEMEANELAHFLDQQNRERQEVEKEILRQVEAKIADRNLAGEAAIVVGERGWHPGVLGIVASRIVRQHHRPTIVIGFDENGTGKGSGRSIEGFNLVKGLTRSADKLEKFGGHEMAAGLTIQESNLAAFSASFAQTAREWLSDDDLQPRLRLDHELSLDEIDIKLLRWHEMLQPFGNGNPQPVFVARAVQSVAPPRVIKEKHLALRIRQGKSQRRAVFFDGASTPLPPEPWDVAFRIRADNFGGDETLVELHVAALRQSGPMS